MNAQIWKFFLFHFLFYRGLHQCYSTGLPETPLRLVRLNTGASPRMLQFQHLLGGGGGGVKERIL